MKIIEKRQGKVPKPNLGEYGKDESPGVNSKSNMHMTEKSHLPTKIIDKNFYVILDSKFFSHLQNGSNMVINDNIVCAVETFDWKNKPLLYSCVAFSQQVVHQQHHETQALQINHQYIKHLEMNQTTEKSNLFSYLVLGNKRDKLWKKDST